MSPRIASFSRNGVWLLAAPGTSKPAKMVLEKSPVSPSMCPVAMLEAFAVVKVGNSAWLLRRLTPSRESRHGGGGVVIHDAKAQSVAATKRTTLCGRAAGGQKPDALSGERRDP